MKLFVVLFALFATGCGTVETGNVGVRITFGTVNRQEVQPGFYVAVLSSVKEFTAKETHVALDNMTPKAKDNLSLQDLDISVYYRVNPAAVVSLYVKYAAQHVYDKGLGYPAYTLIQSLARNAAYEEVAKYDSLTLHTQRDAIANGIHKTLQDEINKGDKGALTITRVVIRAVATDRSIEQSIRDAVAAQKQLEQIEVQNQIAVKQAEIKVTEAKGIAESNRIINSTLTREYLQHELNGVLSEFAKKGGSSVIIPANMTTAPLINIPSPK